MCLFTLRVKDKMFNAFSLICVLCSCLSKEKKIKYERISIIAKNHIYMVRLINVYHHFQIYGDYPKPGPGFLISYVVVFSVFSEFSKDER